MEIFNIGPLELIIILLLMFILLGPKDMILTAQRIGRWVRNFVRSPMWREIWGYSQEIRELPQKIMDESGLEETLAEVQKSTREATDEINAQLKEATDAARVPEAEHVRLDTSVPAVEHTTTVPSATNPSESGAVVPTVEVEQPGVAAANAFLAEAAKADTSAVLDTAETASAAETVSTPEAGAAAESTPLAATEAEKKPRRRKTTEPAETTPESKPVRRARKPKVDPAGDHGADSVHSIPTGEAASIPENGNGASASMEENTSPSAEVLRNNPEE